MTLNTAAPPPGPARNEPPTNGNSAASAHLSASGGTPPRSPRTSWPSLLSRPLPSRYARNAFLEYSVNSEPQNCQTNLICQVDLSTRDLRSPSAFRTNSFVEECHFAVGSLVTACHNRWQHDNRDCQNPHVLGLLGVRPREPEGARPPPRLPYDIVLRLKTRAVSAPAPAAPRGNLNALKPCPERARTASRRNVRHSKQFAALGALVTSYPDIRAQLLDWGRRQDLKKQKPKTSLATSSTASCSTPATSPRANPHRPLRRPPPR